MSDTLKLWQHLADEVAIGRTDNMALHDAIRAVSDDIHKGNLPWDYPKLFVDVLWQLGQLELSLSAQLMLDVVTIKRMEEKQPKLYQFMRDVQDYDGWIEFHRALDAAHRYVEETLDLHSRKEEDDVL